MIKLVIASVLTLAAFSASAQMYGEVGYTSVKLEENSYGDNYKSSPSAVRGVLGFEINPNLAIEGMVGLGLGDDKVTLNGHNAYFSDRGRLSRRDRGRRFSLIMDGQRGCAQARD